MKEKETERQRDVFSLLFIVNYTVCTSDFYTLTSIIVI